MRPATGNANSSSGIAIINGASDNTIGGTTAAARNIISGNRNAGSYIGGAGTTGNMVEGNYVGVGPDGTTPVPNGWNGIQIDSGGASNMIGSSDFADGNTIADNNGAGVAVADDSSTGNTIRLNSIHDNSALGIDLGGSGIPTPNDPINPDTGPNNCQDYPVLAAAVPGSSTLVSGTLHTAPNQTYTLDFYANATLDSNGNAEGNVYLGSMGATTDAAGDVSFTDVPLPGASRPGEWITATATDAGGDTSEFSPGLREPASPIALYVTNTSGDPSVANSLPWAVAQADASIAASVTIDFEIPQSAANLAVGGAASPNVFQIQPLATLVLNSPAPSVTIDGSSEAAFLGGNPNPAGGPTIVLDGSQSGAPSDGLQLHSSTTVLDLGIQSFSGSGVHVFGSGSTVADCYIGSDATGTIAQRNGTGITIDSGASNNIIGGTTAAARNLISGNYNAVVIQGVGATGNVVEGNYIGTNASGQSMGWTDSNGNPVAANTWCGVVIQNGASDNIIGGTLPGARNVISGSGGNGVFIKDPGTVNNLVEGNYLGTDASGDAPLATGSANNDSAIVIYNGASNNTIGGTTAAARNVISGNYNGMNIGGSGTSGNVVEGNYIGVGADGTTPVPNAWNGIWTNSGASDNTIGGSDTADANIIAHNGGAGVGVTDDSTGNTIRLNSIHDNGALGIDLGDDGVTPNDPTNPDTGPNNCQNYPVLTAATAGSSTVVSGTLESASSQTFTLDFYANQTPDPSGYGQGAVYLGSTTVTTDGTGNASFTNVSLAGTSAQDAWITATATDAGRDTSEFSAALQEQAAAPSALLVTNTSGDASVANSLPWAVAQADAAPAGSVIIDFQIPQSAANLAVDGAASPNVFEIQPLATLVLNNPGCSITIDGSSEAAFLGDNPNPAGGPTIVLDGSQPGAPSDGLQLYSSTTVLDLGIQNFSGSGMHLFGSGSTVAGCFIGADATGSVAESNGDGIIIDPGASDNTIGGTTAAARNVISGNYAGVVIQGSGATGNVVEGNYIGVGADGATPVPNAWNGIWINAGASGNTIGGGDTADGNVIAYNAGAGVGVSDDSTGNTIRLNSIHDNGALGIDLGNDGVTPNHPTNPVAGPNNWQNYPVLTAAGAGSSTTVSGTLHSAANQTYTLDFYASPTPDPAVTGKVRLTWARRR